jgi:hypothetical protein
MLYTFNVGHYLSYPFIGREAQKNFLVGSLLMLAGFFIPLIPVFIVYGYISRIMKQVIAGEKASMPTWDDWNTLFTDGLRLYGVRIIYALPLMLLLFTVMAIYFGGLFLILLQDEPSTNALFALIMAFVCIMALMFPLGIVLSMFAYPAGAHTVAKQSFSAGFHVGEWWPILRHNLGGFAMMIGITYVISIAFSILIQVLYITIIFACLLPLIMPAFMFYMILIMEPMAAQAYREGREKAAQPAANARSLPAG